MGDIRKALKKTLISFLMVIMGAICLQYNGVCILIGTVLLAVGMGLVLTLKCKKIK